MEMLKRKPGKMVRRFTINSLSSVKCKQNNDLQTLSKNVVIQHL